MKILDCFNKHFIAFGSLFDSLNPNNRSAFSVLSADQDLFKPYFNLNPILTFEVQKYLKLLDTTKTAGQDKLQPYLLKLAAAPYTHF